MRLELGRSRKGWTTDVFMSPRVASLDWLQRSSALARCSSARCWASSLSSPPAQVETFTSLQTKQNTKTSKVGDKLLKAPEALSPTSFIFSLIEAAAFLILSIFFFLCLTGVAFVCIFFFCFRHFVFAILFSRARHQNLVRSTPWHAKAFHLPGKKGIVSKVSKNLKTWEMERENNKKRKGRRRKKERKKIRPTGGSNPRPLD